VEFQIKNAALVKVRRAADRGKHRQAAGAIAEALIVLKLLPPACRCVSVPPKKEKGRLTVSLKVHECRMSAGECEKRAAGTNDPALKQSYTALAKEWRDVAIQVEHLENQMDALEAHKNSK